MTQHVVPKDLLTALQGCCRTVQKPKHTVLFHRGEASFGMFLILTGSVSLDFGVDARSPLNSSCGPGALVGLPATITGHSYSMTATVTQDAELGFLTAQELKALLHERPELCAELLVILAAKLAYTDQVKKAVLTNKADVDHEVGLA